MSLPSLLWNHRLDVLSHDPEDKYRLKVRRRAVWEDTLNQLKRGLSIDKHLNVVFLGEPAVDTGGPLREFLHLLISSIARNNSLFTGDETHRVPAHNVMEVEKNTYYYVGVMLAISIVHGGPAPSFFSDAVADFLLRGLGKTRPTVYDVPDLGLQQKLIKVRWKHQPYG